MMVSATKKIEWLHVVESCGGGYYIILESQKKRVFTKEGMFELNV